MRLFPPHRTQRTQVASRRKHSRRGLNPLLVLTILFAALFLPQAAAIPNAGAVNIIDLHQNDGMGIPGPIYIKGTPVTVSGIVTSPDSVWNTYSTSVCIQDETAGMNIYVSGGLNQGLHFALGDSVTFSGYIAQYQGLTEIDSSFAVVSLTTHATGRPVPAPLVLTCAQVNSTYQMDNTEPNESRLIRINSVELVSGAWPVIPSTSNVTLQISDGTATTTLYIDKDSGANGTPEPVGYFDVIGILKQYDTSLPYHSGYEIVPRFASDIVYQGLGPIITSGPEEDDITTTSVTIYWTTNTASTSVVEYGETSSYGTTVGDSTTLVTDHAVTLPGLTPGTVYHYRVYSRDAEGTRFSNDRMFVTISDVPGEVHVYFNKSVDTGYSTGTDALGNQNVRQKLIDRINSATYSIDCNFYSFSLSTVTDALIAAKGRGVQVRFIIEDDNSGSYEVQRLINAAIPVITSTYGGNHGADAGWGINHNKFAVFDCQTGSSKTDDWVWTGSWNSSIAGENDGNNCLAIQDHGLASAYKIEFNEMWGSDTATPNPSEARMGSKKSNNTPHKFTISGIPMEQYMSPSDAVEPEIIEAVGTADSTIYFCILSFTSDNISNAMKSKWDSITGFQVRGVFEGSNIGPITSGSEWYAMSGDPASYNQWIPAADVWQDGMPSSDLLHHKYMIIDSSRPLMDPIVITGSHNWSYSANQVNDENTLLIYDATISNVYLQEFAERYHEAGGTGGILVSVGEQLAAAPPPGISLEAFPNPFNPSLNVRYTLGATSFVSLKVYDVAGRLVRTLLENNKELPGFHSVPWDGRDSSGREVGGGVYFVHLDTGQDSRSEKVVLLK
ncbi:MAG: fibronectin type III domain-containing protein [Candidatus Eiseniibacteriota bacterium]|nr:MAG: fibronectin type III domain-containing protein [Candidatus Eisenbacteria bacterium]